MIIQRVAAFSMGNEGGNPAGVVLLDKPISDKEMARVAAEVGYSETVFAVPLDKADRNWRVRFFSPEIEIPFCGHATIALGAVLGKQQGAGIFKLTLNDAVISVKARSSEHGSVATLSSPPTDSQAIPDDILSEVLSLFGFGQADLDDRLPPARIHGGSDHILLPLSKRSVLASMAYDLNSGRDLMRKLGVATIMLLVVEDDQTFVVRNAFASGGVLEDPATGAAAAAFGGYLRYQHWPRLGKFTIRQGEDMGHPSLIEVELDSIVGSPVHVSGATRSI